MGGINGFSVSCADRRDSLGDPHDEWHAVHLRLLLERARRALGLHHNAPPLEPAGQRLKAVAASAADRDPASAPEAGKALPDTLSVVVSLTTVPSDSDLEQVHRTYLEAVQKVGVPYEFIYVLGAAAHGARAVLERLQAADGRTTIVVLRRWPGEAAALASGFQQTRGDVILALPPRLQVDPEAIPRMIAALEHCDMAIARRTPLVPGAWQRLPERLFHWLLKATFGHAFSDLMCRVRACRRRVLDEISHYGLQHHFSPLLALHRGFTIREIDAQPGPASSTIRRSPWVYFGAVLDILALYVLLKFTRKPLRFFGMVGGLVLLAGLLFTAFLVFVHLAYGVPLGDRPALILGVLLIVLGIQIMALGLIGEIIIFASGQAAQDYSVEKVVSRRADVREAP